MRSGRDDELEAQTRTHCERATSPLLLPRCVARCWSLCAVLCSCSAPSSNTWLCPPSPPAAPLHSTHHERHTAQRHGNTSLETLSSQGATTPATPAQTHGMKQTNTTVDHNSTTTTHRDFTVTGTASSHRIAQCQRAGPPCSRRVPLFPPLQLALIGNAVTKWTCMPPARQRQLRQTKMRRHCRGVRE